jgi:hypothetical protein
MIMRHAFESNRRQKRERQPRLGNAIRNASERQRRPCVETMLTGSLQTVHFTERLQTVEKIATIRANPSAILG